MINEKTRVYLIPALPPSLNMPVVRPNHQLVRFFHVALKSLPLAPRVALCHGENARRTAISVCASIDSQIPVLRYAPPTLGAGHGARGIHITLKNALNVAHIAAPTILLLDSIHLLAPPALKENAAAVALAIREVVSIQHVAVILVAGPDELAISHLVRDEVQCTIHCRYEEPDENVIEVQRELSTLSISASPVKSTAWSKVSESVGGIGEARIALEQALLWRRTRRQAYARLGVIPTGGVLLYGSPGTGKTLVARTAASSAGYRLQSLEAAILARGEVGAAERALERAFELAQREAPTVLFIDEIDAMFGEEGRLVNKLAARLDDSNNEVVVVAATNRPWRVAKPLLRAGRLDVQVHTSLPNKDERAQIAAVHSDKMQVEAQVGMVIRREAANAENLSGADIAGACRRAAMNAAAHGREVCKNDVLEAFRATVPSVEEQTAREIASWSPPV